MWMKSYCYEFLYCYPLDLKQYIPLHLFIYQVDQYTVDNGCVIKITVI
jgi:hypothetical protein